MGPDSPLSSPRGLGQGAQLLQARFLFCEMGPIPVPASATTDTPCLPTASQSRQQDGVQAPARPSAPARPHQGGLKQALLLKLGTPAHTHHLLLWGCHGHPQLPVHMGSRSVTEDCREHTRPHPQLLVSPCIPAWSSYTPAGLSAGLVSLSQS